MIVVNAIVIVVEIVVDNFLVVDIVVDKHQKLIRVIKENAKFYKTLLITVVS